MRRNVGPHEVAKKAPLACAWTPGDRKATNMAGSQACLRDGKAKDSHDSRVLSIVLISRADQVMTAMKAEVFRCAAEIRAELTDIGQALNLRRRTDERLVLLVHLESEDDLSKLSRLSGAFPNSSIVAVMDIALDPITLLMTMRAGATQVLPLPLETADFQAVMDRIFIQNGGSGPRGSTIIAVCGVTGGCGATAVSINLGYEISQSSQNQCILLELSRSVGKFATYLDINPRFTIDDILCSIESMDAHQVKQLLTPITERLDIIAGLPRVGRQWTVNPEDLVRLIDYANRLANVTILDLPCSCDDYYFKILATADQVVLVGEQNIPSVGMLKLVSESLSQEGIAATQTLVINRYIPKLPGLSTEHLEERLQVSKLHTIANDYHAMSAAVNHGLPLRLESRHSRTLTDIDNLVRMLVPSEQPEELKKPQAGMLDLVRVRLA